MIIEEKSLLGPRFDISVMSCPDRRSPLDNTHRNASSPVGVECSINIIKYEIYYVDEKDVFLRDRILTVRGAKFSTLYPSGHSRLTILYIFIMNGIGIPKINGEV